MKGKPWEINEVRLLTQLVEEGKSIEEIRDEEMPGGKISKVNYGWDIESND